ncbi:MAG: phosphoribosyltransferase [Candidatus Aenigmarchaeota archaeon]|nr:phosphoribosyltransferase [Candidatus Aenigmarchaeota archaeon]
MQPSDLRSKIRETITSVPVDDKGLLDEIVQRLTERLEFIGSLDNSYSPMDETVESLYQGIELDIKYYRETALINPQAARDILRSKDKDAEEHHVLSSVVRSLFSRKSNEYYSRFDLRPQYASDLFPSLCSARKVIEEGEVDIGVAVGPEGFSYACLFESLGLPIRNIHIDEYCTTEDRPYKELDDLRAIEGRQTLFIEDDVITGKTLQKAHQKIKVYSPADVSVYLGLSADRQQLQNVPHEFRKIYTTPVYLTDEQMTEEIDHAIEILQRTCPIFRNPNNGRNS